MYETLVRFLATWRLSESSSTEDRPVSRELRLDPQDRVHLRQMVESPGWAVLEPRFRELWVGAVNRLLNESDPSVLERRQVEVQTIERLMALPHRLLEKNYEPEE